MNACFRNKKINFVFDIDDTMYDLMEPFKKAHEKLFAERVSADCTGLFMKSRIYSDIILEKEKDGKIRKEDTFFERLRMTYEDVGLVISREESERFEEVYRYYQTRIEMFDFMEEVLDYCRQERIRIAVLTNGKSKGQRRKADALRLERWFDHDWIFPSEEIGYQKPDIRAFKEIENRMDFLPEDTWYIGDTYESDITGAKKAGWHTVWLNHRNRECPAGISEADRELKSGKELLPFLQDIVRESDNAAQI